MAGVGVVEIVFIALPTESQGQAEHLMPLFVVFGAGGNELSGTESAILNRESGDSGNRAIRRSQLNIDRLRFTLAILNRRSAILLYYDSTPFCTSRCGNSGDSWPVILGIVWFAIRDSVPLRRRAGGEA